MNNQELLEAVAPYLPYGLMAYNENQEYKTDKIVGIFRHHLDFENWSPANTVISSYKFVLRPLSDLTKPCLEGGKVPIDEIRQYLIAIDGDHGDFDYLGYEDYCHRFNYYGLNLAIKSLPYYVVQWLYKHHFDVNDLIPRHAVDFNTLTPHK